MLISYLAQRAALSKQRIGKLFGELPQYRIESVLVMPNSWSLDHFLDQINCFRVRSHEQHSSVQLCTAGDLDRISVTVKVQHAFGQRLDEEKWVSQPNNINIRKQGIVTKLQCL